MLAASLMIPTTVQEADRMMKEHGQFQLAVEVGEHQRSVQKFTSTSKKFQNVYL